VAQLRDIKDRIESVQKTQKMTQAMKMVAAAKFKRASERALNTRPYIKYLKNTLAMVQSQSGDVDSPLLASHDSNVQAVIIISSDRGLCGGFNSNIIREAENYLKAQVNPVKLYVFGSKAYQHFKSLEWEIVGYYEGLDQNLDSQAVKEYLGQIESDFNAGSYEKVMLFYNEFQSAISTNLISTQLLPFHMETEEEQAPADYIFEPSAEAIFGMLVEETVLLTLYSAFLESFAAEQGARMAAMDSATENAGEMIKSLKLVYNRQRQAQITTELSEIVAGAEALAG
jgi:F-type H+-transporting ATPase subunit gamma